MSIFGSGQHGSPFPPSKSGTGYALPPQPVYPYSSEVQVVIDFEPTRKTHGRVTQACNTCRQLKTKCDELKPCKNCKDNSLDCRYQRTASKPGMPEVKKALEDFRESMEKHLQAAKPVWGLWNLESPQSSPPSLSASSPSSAADHTRPTSEGASDQGLSSTECSSVPGGHVLPKGTEQPPGPALVPGKPSIPPNHTTAAGLLLEWPAVQALTQDSLTRLGIKYLKDFPISQEQNRGLLRLFGCGEGSGSDYARLDVASSDSPLDCSPGVTYGNSPQCEPWAIRNAKSFPDFSESSVQAYVKSFKEHVLSMHPILTPGNLDLMVKRFLEHVSAEDVRCKNEVAGCTSVPADPLVPRKLQRSISAGRPKEPVQQRRGPLRTTEHALVMVILALGKVSQHKGKIRDFFRDERDNRNSHTTLLHTNDLPGSRKVLFSSDGTDFRSTYFAKEHVSNNITPSPPPHMEDPDRRSAARSLRPNYQDVPGLEYFALASDTMGGYFGDVSITHVHTLVFASLYLGQLGRVVESHGHIYLAARALVLLMRRDLYNFQQVRVAQSGGTPALISNTEDNTKIMTYWTCLQLESDILAELPLPPSPILNFEEYMPWPNMDLLKAEFSKGICEAYLGQLHLRKQLNLIHSMLYDPDPSKERFEEALNIAESLRSMQWTTPTLRFSENDKPADNLFDARLRAKYWGAQVLVCRPSIKRLLDASVQPKQQPDVATHNSKTILSGLQDVWRDDRKRDDIIHAKRGIEALFNSTEAFHGLDPGQRLLVNNTFGTAHAQWGNLLVLSASYRDPNLSQHVDGDRLKRDFLRTFQMFTMHAQSSGALEKDLQILKDVFRQLFDAK